MRYSPRPELALEPGVKQSYIQSQLPDLLRYKLVLPSTALTSVSKSSIISNCNFKIFQNKMQNSFLKLQADEINFLIYQYLAESGNSLLSTLL